MPAGEWKAVMFGVGVGVRVRSVVCEIGEEARGPDGGLRTRLLTAVGSRSPREVGILAGLLIDGRPRMGSSA